MPKLERGSTRAVLLIGPFAIKFPSIFLVRGTGDESEWRKMYFWRGIIGNITEYANYRLNREFAFLTPVYFSCGFFSIQKRERGRHPTDKELWRKLEGISREIDQSLSLVDSHHLQRTNFIVNDEGWHVIDYGDHLGGQGMTFIRFLMENNEELAKAFSHR